MSSTPADERPPVRHRGIILFSVIAATFMQSLDTTVANIALPHMQGALSATQDQMSWVLTSYIVIAAIFMPLSGWLADRYGQRDVLLWSVGGFTVASILCGMAGTLSQIVLFRLLQGAFGAAVVPLSQSVLLDTTPREHYGRALAIWGASSTMGPVLGPLIGGWLTDDFNWRWVFYVNIPIGVLAFCGLLFFLSEIRPRQKRPFDFFGFAMLSLGVGALQLLLDRGQTLDWFGSTEICVEFFLAVGGIWLFLVQVLTSPQPFVNLAMFKDRSFAVGSMAAFIFYGVYYASLALFPPMLQTLMNYPVITAGEMMAPRGLGTVVAMLLVSRWGHADGRLVLTAGLLITAFSFWQMTGFSLQVDSWPIFSTGLLMGFGMGLISMPINLSAFTTLPPHMRNEASSFFALIRNFGGSIGIAVAENVFVCGSQISHASITAYLTPFNAALHLPGALRFWDLHSRVGLAALDAEVNRQASMIAYIANFKLTMIAVLLMMPLVFLMRGNMTPKSPGTAPVTE